MTKIKTCSLAILLVSSLPFTATVQAEETGAGCGVGKIVMEGQEGKVAHISAALINGVINFLSGPVVAPVNLFAMTSGTLGCDVTQTVSREYATEKFIAANQDNLMIEIAQGHGAHLSSLADLMQVSQADKAYFFSSLQANYQIIATAKNITQLKRALSVTTGS